MWAKADAVPALVELVQRGTSVDQIITQNVPDYNYNEYCEPLSCITRPSAAENTQRAFHIAVFLYAPSILLTKQDLVLPPHFGKFCHTEEQLKHHLFELFFNSLSCLFLSSFVSSGRAL